MKLMKILVLCIACVVSMLILPAYADTAKVDYLAGIGDFERCAETRWWSSYRGADYDFNARSGYSSPPKDGARSGVYLPAHDDTVATGWRRVSNSTVNPGSNIICKIVDGQGINRSRCQYLGVKDLAEASISLASTLYLNANNRIQPGDKLTFAIDRIFMEDFSGLPIRYSLSIAGAGKTAEKVLAASTTPFADQVSFILPAGCKGVDVIVRLIISGDLHGHKPGALIDGARLYVTKAGQTNYVERRSCVGNERRIKTIKLAFNMAVEDVIDIALDNDIAVLQPVDYWYTAKLKSINPKILVYMYQMAGTIGGSRDSAGADDYYTSAIAYGYVSKNRPNWIYSNAAGGYCVDPAFPTTYYAKTSDAEYQSTWSKSVINMLSRYGFDGVFVDTLGPLTEKRQDGKLLIPEREAWELQQFAHNAFPKILAAGYDVIQNGYALHRQTGWGPLVLDPFWTPKAPYKTSYYTANTPTNISSGHLQEAAFFRYSPSRHMIFFDKEYWKQCLDDMDYVTWCNTQTGSKAIPVKNKQREHMLVWGADMPSDPATGVDGWLNFGLASYLLAYSEWTTYSYSIDNAANSHSRPNQSMAITKKLGAPDGTHKMLNGDPYFRCRHFNATDDGESGGVVVVNANTDASRTYMLEFDAADETGAFVGKGTPIVLKPHTGRIFVKKSSQR